MKRTIILMCVSLMLGSCKHSKEEVNSGYVISQFIKNSKEVEKVEYNVQRIDTFPSGHNWNKKGFAVVEKNENDKNLGISFYGKSNDSEIALLYENGKGYKIDTAEKKYEILPIRELRGSPGGQMLVENIFHLDTIFKNVRLIEKENSYLLKYYFEPESLFDNIDSERIVELRKKDFFPIKVSYRAKKLGRTYFTQQILNDIKINNQVERSVSDYKNLISNFDAIQPTETDY